VFQMVLCSSVWLVLSKLGNGHDTKESDTKMMRGITHSCHIKV
jgi:hypothetical protein